MTRDDIIRLARECGIDIEQDTLCRFEGWVEPMEKFAALAAAAEREACAKLCEQKSAIRGGEVFATRIRARGRPRA
jgi:5,10-methylenetetrahydrofolate reductase